MGTKEQQQEGKEKVCVIEEILLRTVDVYNFASVGCINRSDLITE